MPIYEFYCPDCNTVFSFFSSRVNPDAAPDCPQCARPKLERKPSRFAALRRAGGPDKAEAEGDEGLSGLEEGRVEGAMESLAAELDSMGDGIEENPRQLARFFRRFGDLAGLEAGPKMEDMIQRLEAGADPDSLEDDFGDGEDPDSGGFDDFFRLKKQALAARAGRKPKVDETLYFL
jgi:putative FmdB family regulatory protein